ncbi:MAG: hypothetical protein ABIS47_05655 [Acidimicrobiales bacterium]
MNSSKASDSSAVLGPARVVGGRDRRIASIAAGLVVFAVVGLGGSIVAEQLLGVAATLDGDGAAMVRLAKAAESTPAFFSMVVLPQVPQVPRRWARSAWPCLAGDAATRRSGVRAEWPMAVYGLRRRRGSAA